MNVVRTLFRTPLNLFWFHLGLSYRICEGSKNKSTPQHSEFLFVKQNKQTNKKNWICSDVQRKITIKYFQFCGCNVTDSEKGGMAAMFFYKTLHFSINQLGLESLYFGGELKTVKCLPVYLHGYVAINTSAPDVLTVWHCVWHWM